MLAAEIFFFLRVLEAMLDMLGKSVLQSLEHQSQWTKIFLQVCGDLCTASFVHDAGAAVALGIPMEALLGPFLPKGKKLHFWMASSSLKSDHDVQLDSLKHHLFYIQLLAAWPLTKGWSSCLKAVLNLQADECLRSHTNPCEDSRTLNRIPTLPVSRRTTFRYFSELTRSTLMNSSRAPGNGHQEHRIFVVFVVDTILSASMLTFLSSSVKNTLHWRANPFCSLCPLWSLCGSIRWVEPTCWSLVQISFLRSSQEDDCEAQSLRQGRRHHGHFWTLRQWCNRQPVVWISTAKAHFFLHEQRNANQGWVESNVSRCQKFHSLKSSCIRKIPKGLCDLRLMFPWYIYNIYICIFLQSMRDCNSRLLAKALFFSTDVYGCYFHHSLTRKFSFANTPTSFPAPVIFLCKLSLAMRVRHHFIWEHAERGAYHWCQGVPWVFQPLAVESLGCEHQSRQIFFSASSISCLRYILNFG